MTLTTEKNMSIIPTSVEKVDITELLTKGGNLWHGSRANTDRENA